MNVSKVGKFNVATLEDNELSTLEKNRIIGMVNDELTDELMDMLQDSLKYAKPKVLFGVVQIESKSESGVTIEGVNIKSMLMRKNFDKTERVFPYIGTCGSELEEWSLKYEADPVLKYLADMIKEAYLRNVTKAHVQYAKECYGITGHFTSMNPGSVSEKWPLSGQQELFDIFGGRDFVMMQIGVSLTQSFLLLPAKSVSGIYFTSEEQFENCQFCPLINCPQRRAKALNHAYDSESSEIISKM